MAEAVRKPAKGAKGGEGPDEAVKAQSVDELEREMLGPKAPKPPKSEKTKGPKEKKPVGRLEVGILTSLVWLSIMSAFVLLVLFDPTSEKVIRNTTFLLINPEWETFENLHMSDIMELQDEWRDIEEERRMLVRWEAELDLREVELDDWENELFALEADLEDRWEDIVENGTAGGGEHVGDAALVARTWRRMQPAVAARSMQEMDFDVVLRSVVLMSDKDRARIFDVLDPEFLVELLDAMGAAPELDDW
jgi:flagellar motility protein MotE (MotC chaperone)